METVDPVQTDPKPSSSPFETNHNNQKKRNVFFLWMTAFFILVGLGYFVYWLTYGRFREYTDDAYVNGNMVTLTPLVAGIVTKIYVQDTDFVAKDTPLVQLDPTDHIITLDKHKKMLAESVRNVAQLFARARELEADLEVKKADFVRRAQDFEHRKLLVDSGGVSLEDFEHATSYLSASYFSLMATEQQLIGILSQIENTTIDTHPLVEEEKQKVKEAYIRLKRCTLSAPVSGLIAQRQVQVGEWVKPTQSLLAVVPLDQIWVDANFKEVQLSNMRIGQMVKLKSDIYGRSVIFQGTVSGIGGGTGSVFSLLPPQNATGNWIKIVQRLPVRVDIPLAQLKDHPLRLGLSMEVTVDTQERLGPMIPSARPLDVVRFDTDIFATEEEGVEEEIQQIISENLSSFARDLQTPSLESQDNL